MSKANGTQARPASNNGTHQPRVKPPLNGRIDPVATNGQVETGPRHLVVPLANLRPWGGNPRKTFDEAALKDLAANLKELGMLQPILVRPLYRTASGSAISRESWPETVASFPGLSANGLYEIADGERRYRAAKFAGLVEVPVIVRELTDRQMLEIAIVSFEQRADVSAAEKCAGYQRLIDDHGATVEEIAAQVGRSVSTIRGLLKLRQLPKFAAEAMAAGEIPQSTAELIARVPGEAARERAAYAILCGGDACYNGKLGRNDLVYARKNGVAPLSFRLAKELIDREYTRELKGAPFSRKSIDLVPAAGSCDACPKRTGNDPEAFGGARADVCTDTACFAAKVAAHAAEQIRLAEASGKKVLTGKEADKVFNGLGRSISSSAPYLDLGDECYDDPETRAYAAVLGKSIEPDIVLVVDPAGNVHKLLPRPIAEKALKAAGIGGNHGGGMSAGEKRRRADDAMKARAGNAAAREAILAVGAKMKAAAAGAIGLNDGVTGLIRDLLLAQVGESWSDAVRLVERAHDLPAERKHQGPRYPSLVAYIQQLPLASGVLALWAELVAARMSVGWGNTHMGGPQDGPLWKAFGVAPKKIVARLLAEAKAGKKGKKPAAAAEDPGDDDGNDETEHDLGVGDQAAAVADAASVGNAEVPPGRRDLQVGDRVALESDRESLGSVTATRSHDPAGAFVVWDAPPGKKKGNRGWCSVSVLVLADPPLPAAAPDSVTLDTPLTRLAAIHGADCVVGYEITLAEILRHGLHSVADLLDRARATHKRDLGNALAAALKAFDGVSSEMARRVSAQLQPMLQALWGDPEAATKRVAAKAKERRCRECELTEAELAGDVAFVADDLCSRCEEAMAHA